MDNLILSSIELTSTVRTAPLNGSPSSSDFNAYCKEVVNDLAEIVGFLNESLIPVLSKLPAASATGLAGNTVYANTDSQDPFYQNQADGSYYTVADVLSNLSNVTNQLSRAMDDVTARVEALQTRLATTDQNDLRVSMQSLQQNVQTINESITTINSALATQVALSSKLISASVATPTLTPNQTSTVDLLWGNPILAPVAISLTVEGNGSLQLLSFIRKQDNTGVTATVKNTGSSNATGTLHLLARVE